MKTNPQAIDDNPAHGVEEVSERVGRDIGMQIVASIEKLKSAEEEDMASQFWSRFVPHELKKTLKISRTKTINKRPSAKRAKSASNSGATLLGEHAYPLAQYFYNPWCPKVQADKLLDTPCNYEVLIPYDQPGNDFFRAFIVPSGADVGNTVVYLSLLLPARLTPLMRSVCSPLLTKKGKWMNKEDAKGIFVSFRENRAGLLKVCDFRISTDLTRLIEEPLVRFPCYNIPFQCAYEMASDNVGDFWINNREAWLELWKRGKTKYNFKRKKIDLMDLYLMFLYPFFQIAKIKENDQPELVHSVMTHDGQGDHYAGIAPNSLQKKCDRILENHLKRKYPPKLY